MVLSISFRKNTVHHRKIMQHTRYGAKMSILDVSITLLLVEMFFDLFLSEMHVRIHRIIY